MDTFEFYRICEKNSGKILERITNFLIQTKKQTNSISLIISPNLGPNDSHKLKNPSLFENNQLQMEIEKCFFGEINKKKSTTTFSLLEILSPTNNKENLRDLQTLIFLIFPVERRTICGGDEINIQNPNNFMMICSHSIENSYPIENLLNVVENSTNKKLSDWNKFTTNKKKKRNNNNEFYILSDIKQDPAFFSLEKYSIINMDPFAMEKTPNRNFFLSDSKRRDYCMTANPEYHNAIGNDEEEDNNEPKIEQNKLFVNPSSIMKKNINRNWIISSPKKHWKSFAQQIFFYNNRHTQSDLFRLKKFHQLMVNTNSFQRSMTQSGKTLFFPEIFRNFKITTMNTTEINQLEEIEEKNRELIEKELSIFYEEQQEFISFVNILRNSFGILSKEKWLEFFMLSLIRIFKNRTTTSNYSFNFEDQQEDNRIEDCKINLEFSIASGILYYTNDSTADSLEHQQQAIIDLEDLILMLININIIRKINKDELMLEGVQKIEQFKNYLIFLVKY